MDQKFLNQISPFDLKIGDPVYDIVKDRDGYVCDIRETSYEYIEAFVRFFDEPGAEYRSNTLRNCILGPERKI
jgi:hypothetical protein